MGQSKDFKRSMVITALTAMMSVVLFVGSTFAWVSDSMASGNTVMMGGSLDAKLEYRPAVINGAGYSPVGEMTSIFKEGAVWVPGHVEAYNLRVSNVGSVGFLYQLRIQVTEETAGVDLAGQPLKLSQQVKCFILEGKQEFASGADAVAAVTGEPLSIGEAVMTVQGGLEKTATEEITLVVWMPDDLGDEVNYLSANGDPRLKLGVTMVATQLAKESDGYSDGYDQGAAEILNTLL